MKDDGESGVRCPRCNCPESEVTHTRKQRGKKIRRYRVCRYCRKRFMTLERVG